MDESLAAQAIMERAPAVSLLYYRYKEFNIW